MPQDVGTLPAAPAAPEIRKLVSIRRISHTARIPRTRFEQVFVDGWSVVERISRGFCPGQLVVFFEIDSFIPATDDRIWELHQYFVEDALGRKGLHVRSCSAYGVMSQGMMFRLEAIPEINKELERLVAEHGWQEGTRKAMDMSFEGLLGVTKWQVPVHPSLDGALGPPPDFFPMPGYFRAQNKPSLFDADKMSNMYHVTEKLDGDTMIVYHLSKESPWNHSLPTTEGVRWVEDGRIGVCNRRADIAEDPRSVFWEAARKQELLDLIQQMGIKDVALLGELCGSTILNNTMGFPEGEHRFFAFDIYDIAKQKSLPFEEAQAVFKRLGISHVPVLGRVRMRDFARNLNELLQKAEGTGCMEQNREGLVLTSVKDGSQTKVISNSWLLEKGM